MKKPIIDEYDRFFLTHHRGGQKSLAGALIELDVAVLKLRRELFRLLLGIYKKMKIK